MPVIRVNEQFRKVLFLAFFLPALSPSFVAIWQCIYETTGNETLRLVMRFLQGMYTFHEDLSFSILWPVPKEYLPYGWRSLLVTAVHVLIAMAAYDYYLHTSNGEPVSWEFLTIPENVQPHGEEATVVCPTCQGEFDVFSQEEEYWLNDTNICASCMSRQMVG